MVFPGRVAKRSSGFFDSAPAALPYRRAAQNDSLSSGDVHWQRSDARFLHHRLLISYAPVGLFGSESKQLASLNTADGQGNFFLKPNGVFLITETGAQVVESSEYPKIRERVILATQSGPMLVHRGKIHPAFNVNSQSRLFRNGVCAPTRDLAVFVNSEAPLNFYEFASFFRDTLRCNEALFLDGTISSLHSIELKRSDFRMDLGPIIGIAE